MSSITAPTTPPAPTSSSNSATPTSGSLPARAETAPQPELRPNLFPALRYHDADAAIAWLDRAFGFVPARVFRNEDGSVAHAELTLGPGTVMLSSAKDDDLRLVSPRDLGSTTCCLCVWVGDVDAVAERARAAGAELTYGPRDTHYGSRELAVRDPERQLWVFGTYYPGSC